MSSADSHSERVMELAEEFLERYRKGERPPLREYINRHPELAAEIKEVFPAMALMENIALADESMEEATSEAVPPPVLSLKQLGDYRIIREIGRGGMGVVYEAEQVSLGRHVALKLLPNHALQDTKQKRRFEREAKAAAKLHHTNIVPVFGVGEDDGVPYYVMQYIQGLGLDAVLTELKQLQLGKAPTREQLPVSRREVSAADVARSLMTGTFEQGEENDLEDRPGLTAPFDQPVEDRLAQQTPLPESLDPDLMSPSSSSITLAGPKGSKRKGSARRQSYWHNVATIGRQVAEALEYAHKQGILHRDVKPSNLLLDLRGTVWVTDFGLAKVAGPAADNLTHTGDILGTLRYMPPEAFEGHSDARSDVYSLGLTLYELLAMRSAFDEKERNRLIKQVTTGEPPSLDKVRRGIPRDLVTIIQKAIAREPARRYTTADALAADLQRFLDDEPIEARRQTQMEQVARWARHNPGIAGLGTVLAGILVMVTIASLVAAGYFNKLSIDANDAADKEKIARKAAEKSEEAEASERRRAEDQLGRAELLVYKSNLSLAQSAFEEGKVELAHRLLEECQWNLRGWEHRHLCNRFNSRQTLRGHTSKVTSVAWSPDGRRILTGSADNTAKIWDAEVGNEIFTLCTSSPHKSGHSLTSVAWSPNGKRILTGSGDYLESTGETTVWDAETGKQIFTIKDQTKIVKSVAWSPDGKCILTGSEYTNGSTGEAKVWNARNGREIFTLKGHIEGVCSVVWSPDGKSILTGSNDKTAKVWDAENGKVVLSLEGHLSEVNSVGWSPDSKRILTRSNDQTAKVWDAKKGKEIFTLKIHNQNQDIYDWNTVAWSPDGKRILTNFGDTVTHGDATVWDAENGQFIFSLKGHHRAVSSVAWSPDGKRIVTGSQDKTAKIWDAELGQEDLSLNSRSPFDSDVAWSPDCKRIVHVGHVIFELQGKSTHQGEATVWESEKGKEILSITGLTKTVTSVAWSPDGKYILTGGGDDNKLITKESLGEAKVWDAEKGIEIFSLKGHTNVVNSVAWSHDGKRLLTGSEGLNRTGEAKVWDAENGKEIFALKGITQPVTSVAWSPDCKRILTGGSGNIVELGEAKVWDAEKGQEIITLKGNTTNVTSVAWSPDGKRILTGHENGGFFAREGEAKVWDAENGREIYSLKSHPALVNTVAWSPDGKRIITGGNEGTVKVWDSDKGQEIFTIKGFNWDVNCIAWSPDGNRLLVRTKILVAEKSTEIFSLNTSGLYACPSWSPDCKKILTTGTFDNSIKVWDAEKGHEIFALKGHKDRVTSLGWSPDGKRILTGSKDKTAKVWDAANGKEIYSINDNEAKISGVGWSPDGERIVTLTTDHKKNSGETKVWKAANGKQIFSLMHNFMITCVAWSPDSKRILTDGANNTSKVWDAESGKEVQSFEGHKAQLTSLAWRFDGKRILTASLDNTVKIWDAENGKVILSINIPIGEEIHISWSPDGKRFIGTYWDKLTWTGGAKLWDAETGLVLHSFKGLALPVNNVAWSPDGNHILVCCSDGTTRLFNANQGPKVLSLTGHKKLITNVAWSTDGKRIFAWDIQNYVLAWYAVDGKPAPATEAPKPSPGSARSPDGQFVAKADGFRIVLVDLLKPGFNTNTNAWPLPDLAERISYHTEQAALAEKENQWFAVAFHVGRLLLDAPEDANLKMRREEALRKHQEESVVKARLDNLLYQACRAASLAAADLDDGEVLDAAARAKLRSKALNCLKALLAMDRKRIESGNTKDREAAQAALLGLQEDKDLASIRDAEALAKLPVEEQKAFAALWAEVAALLKKTEEKAK